jgi:hypothetical protein
MTISARSSQLPFILCQHYQLPWVLERSFKLELGIGLLADRYVLGVPAAEITPVCLEGIVRDMAMPASDAGMIRRLTSELSRASTVYFGYEGNTHSTGSLRLYFEYWDEVVSALKSTPASVISGWTGADRPIWEMGVGYKWHVNDGIPGAIGSLYHSDYWVQPMLPQSEIKQQSNRKLLRCGMAPQLRSSVNDVIATILNSATDIHPVFLQARELDSPRDSIDLCVHRYNLRLRDLEGSLVPIVQQVLGASFLLSHCLQGRSSDAWMTHLSAGMSRNGAPYIGLYYEPTDIPEQLG